MRFGSVWWRWQRVGLSKMPSIGESEVADLKSSLSPEALALLEGKSLAEQRGILAGWIRQAIRHSMASFDMKGRSAITDEDLARFFEKELTDQQRDRLLSLPNEEMQRELRQMYLMSKRGMGDRPNRFRKPGSEGPNPWKPRRNRSSDAASGSLCPDYS